MNHNSTKLEQTLYDKRLEILNDVLAICDYYDLEYKIKKTNTYSLVIQYPYVIPDQQPSDDTTHLIKNLERRAPNDPDQKTPDQTPVDQPPVQTPVQPPVQTLVQPSKEKLDTDLMREAIDKQSVVLLSDMPTQTRKKLSNDIEEIKLYIRKRKELKQKISQIMHIGIGDIDFKHYLGIGGNFDIERFVKRSWNHYITNIEADNKTKFPVDVLLRVLKMPLRLSWLSKLPESRKPLISDCESMVISFCAYTIEEARIKRNGGKRKSIKRATKRLRRRRATTRTTRK